MKTMCKADGKKIAKNLDEIMREVARPRYVCARCARSARTKKLLCRPVRIVKNSP